MSLLESHLDVTTADVVSLFLLFASAGVLAIVVYRLHFHPLSRYPGPFWARITSFPSYWHTLRQDRHIWLWRLQEEYGPTFRYRPDSILVNTPSAYAHIFGPKGNVKKGLYYQAWPRHAKAVTTWNSIDFAIHSRKRRVLNYAFSSKALRSAEPFVLSNADRWCELLDHEVSAGGEWSGSVNMTDWVNWLVFDILGDLCFGKSFGMKEPGGPMREAPDLMADMLKLINPIAFAPFTALWVWLKPRGLDSLLAVATPPPVKRWGDFVTGCLADRTKEEQQAQMRLANEPDFEVRKDFFHYLFHAQDPQTGKGFPIEELWGEAESLIIAGSDTTAIVLTAMFFYLARKPEIQTKLAEEIRSTFHSFDDIAGGPSLYGCRYLKAFIQESLRMAPPVGAELDREVLKGGTVVDGEFIPEGVNVSAGHYCLSYNKDIFPEPLEFRPERWIVGEEEKGGASAESVALAESAFCAFSTGSRGCPGKNLAWLEMMIVMAKIIYRFEVRRDFADNLGGGSPDGRWGRRNVDQYQTYDAFVSLREGPMVQFKRRQLV
ncbi:hypothetical protein Daus18300_003232 [Diaporthe australafricana]|uniref:Benzoate 4-monooxygenase cytochrome P450 n=1 Tax=Diaporthe australafricana TaxID=127596 RepID=A0ABR3XHT8_9PEZI